jgi:hypothetical protein
VAQRFSAAMNDGNIFAALAAEVFLTFGSRVTLS